jgi:outer membrane receptor protein involved in Fe transport
MKAIASGQRQYAPTGRQLTKGVLTPILLLLSASLVAAEPIPEVVVTARKRSESLESVPVAVTVFSTEELESPAIVSLVDLARFTPGVAMNSTTGRQATSYRPVFRGVTTVRNGVANASAGGTFVDGIYVSGGLLAAEMDNLARVEILRGPQSAQFGRNTYAGAINYVTRAPLAAPAGAIKLTGAEHDTQEASGWWSGPLMDERALLWIGAGHREYGGEWTNSRDGSDIGSEKSDEVSAKLLLRPTEALDVTLRLGWQRTDDGHYPMYLQPRTLNNCCERSAEAPRAREYYLGKAQPENIVNLYTDLLEQNGGAGNQLDRSSGSLAINWQFDGMTLTSLTGLLKDRLESGFDSSYAGYDPSPPIAPGSFLIRETREFHDASQELRLASAADQRLRFIAGLYYYKGDAETVRRSRIVPTTGIAIPDPTGRDKVENHAVFGSLEYDFATDWTAGVELRWAEDEVTVTSSPVSATGCDSTRCNDTFRSLTPRFTLAWQATEDLGAYANIGKGTKPGDFNSKVPTLTDGSPDEGYRVVGEETLWSYELGLKADLLADRLTLLLSTYYLEIKDQQVTTLIELDTGGTASILVNAGETGAYGIEAEIQAALTDNISVHASYAWTRSEFDEYISPEEADLRGGDGSYADTQLLGDVSGKHSPRVPEHMASLAARYQRALTADTQWYTAADWTYESSKYAQEHNLIETGDRQVVGLQAGLQQGRWDASLWVRNLFDDDTPADVIRYFDGRYGSLATDPDGQPYNPPLPPTPSGVSRASAIPRGFAIPLTPGRQVGITVRLSF